MNKILFGLTFASLTLTSFLYSQQPSLRINEVSNGTSGEKEYVELIVTGQPGSGCNAQTLDLRGWIFDDNNGYFAAGSGTGIANGAIRFSSNNLWQAVPVGTLILIYNNLDYDPTIIPAQDLSLTDGNCRLVIPVNNTNLFEKNSQPNQNTSTYPTTGWSAGGIWTNIGLANSNDSFQIYSPDNLTTPVHAVSYGNNTSNTVIYFAGAGGGKVFSCMNTTNNDYSLQSNWQSVGAATGQTPGIPNSPQNAAYINSLNPTCSINNNPLTISVSQTNVSCNATCNGAATVTINGGEAPYTVTWHTNANGTTISDLCTGTYTVTVTDNSGCDAQETFTITNDGGVNLNTSPDQSICADAFITLSASGADTYTWDQGLGNGPIHTVQPSVTTTYTVTGTSNGCSDTKTITITVNPSPSVSAGADIHSCDGNNIVLTASGADTYAWDQGIVNGQPFNLTPGTYTYTVTGTSAGCSATDQVTVTVGNIKVTAGEDTTICVNDSYVLNASGANTYTWPGGRNNGDLFSSSQAGIYTLMVTGTSQTCTDTDEVIITVINCQGSGDSYVEFPNVFTPNGDDINDVFKPSSFNNILPQQLIILNRWGNEVFHSTEPDINFIEWTGITNDGIKASEGVYFYKFIYQDAVGTNNTLHGFVHLIMTKS